MSVAGDVSEMPLPELLTVLANKCGHLMLQDAPHLGRLHVFLKNGFITAFDADGRQLKKPSEVIDKLVAATHCSVTRFTFLNMEPESVPERISMDVTGTALEVARLVDQIEFVLGEEFSCDQIFRLESESASQAIDDPAVREFFQQATESLKFGISSNKLAPILQLSARQVGYYLVQLEQLGKIKPLTRDAVWSRFNKALESKTSALRLAGGKEVIPASRQIELPKKITRRPPSLEQKVVPVLGKRPPKSGLPSNANSVF
ncbi:MAG: DUF4388 domain-containing protein [Verrucomicrobiales bacterium]